MIVDTVPTGWLCPRCKRIWSPDVLFCDCDPGKSEEAPPKPRTVLIGVLPVTTTWYETRSEHD